MDSSCVHSAFSLVISSCAQKQICEIGGVCMNLPTIIVATIVAILFLAIVVKGIQNKKNGKSSCSCGGSCGSCGMSGTCHSHNK